MSSKRPHIKSSDSIMEQLSEAKHISSTHTLNTQKENNLLAGGEKFSDNNKNLVVDENKKEITFLNKEKNDEKETIKINSAESNENVEDEVEMKVNSLKVNGDEVNGNEVNGNEVNGNEVNGNEVNGDEVNRDEVNGDEVNGDEVNGDEVNGDEDDEDEDDEDENDEDEGDEDKDDEDEKDDNEYEKDDNDY